MISYFEAAGSVATVAIATLGGPTPAAGAVLTELVKYGRRWFEADAERRSVWLAVATQVETAAAGDNVEKTMVLHALDAAAAAISQHGLSVGELADLAFDSERAATTVIARTIKQDRHWVLEPSTAIAERAIHEAYRALVRQHAERQPVLIASCRSLSARAESLAATLHTMEATVGELADALSADATVDDAIRYLRAQSDRWDEPIWAPIQHLRISELERRLTLVPVGIDGIPNDAEIDADEALEGTTMLVVLGGPGAGKTWLARHYARDAARRALEALQSGAPISSVEFPLLATWDRWAQTASTAGIRERLVNAALGSGVSDLGPGGAGVRLQRTLTLTDMRVLMIVDSLDEAAEVPTQGTQTTNLRDLATLHTWRTVVTSRPGAWHATTRGRDLGSSTRITELQPLDYHNDIRSFVETWFVDQPDRGRRLMRQIENRPHLNHAAAVPLLLTFYCLLAEDSGELPTLRRELFEQLTIKLLLAEWVEDQPQLVDLEDCLRTLGEWAFTAMRGVNEPSSLQTWPETFVQPTSPAPGQARGLDHIVPRVDTRNGTPLRRFVHHTLFEHFLARHIATRFTARSAAAVLSHLWSNQYWEAAAPAALAAHPKRAKLLGILRERLAIPDDLATQDDGLARDFAQFLVRTAAESRPSDWDETSAAILHEARTQLSPWRSDLLVASAHWTDSNPLVVNRLVKHLPAAGTPWMAARLGQAMAALTSTQERRAEVLTALSELRISSHTRPRTVALIGSAVAELRPTYETRREALIAVLGQLSPQDTPGWIDELGATLTALASTDELRRQVSTALFNHLTAPDTPPPTAAALGLVAADFNPTQEQRIGATTALLNLMTAPYTSLRTAALLGSTLAALDPVKKSRAQGLAVLLKLLTAPDAWPWMAAEMGPVVAALATTEHHREQVSTALLNQLAAPDTHPWMVTEMGSVVAALATTDHHREQVSTALLNQLAAPDTHPCVAARLGWALPALHPAEELRMVAITALLERRLAPGIQPWIASELQVAVVALA